MGQGKYDQCTLAETFDRMGRDGSGKSSGESETTLTPDPCTPDCPALLRPVFVQVLRESPIRASLAGVYLCT